MSGRQRTLRQLTRAEPSQGRGGGTPSPRAVVVSAEHGGNRVPREYDELFRGHEALLASHRGWDPGTGDLARKLARGLTAPCLVADVTRLLVDLNRSAHHPRVFSEITRGLPAAARTELIRRFHAPHRNRVAEAVAGATAAGFRVLHLGVHSFTPVLNGVERRADLALLYDPARPAERALAGAWVQALRLRLPDLRVRRNYPYRGAADGLTTTLRRGFPDTLYLGIEVEVNQGLLAPDGRFRGEIARALVETLPGA